jgi:DNA-binding CsgD family transcriptional regulator
MAQDRKLSKQELKIIELWEAGYTGQQIGKELSITRNAVMGKIYRLRRMAKLGYGH